MRATITPLGGHPYTVETTSESWQETERGGLSSLKFDALTLTDAQLAELTYSSTVEMSVPGRAPLLARVLRTSGSSTIECGGWQTALDDLVGGVSYSITKLDAWKARYSNVLTAEARAQAWFVKKAENQTGSGGFMVELADFTSSLRLKFSWARAAQANYTFEVFTGVVNASDLNESWTWTKFGASLSTSSGGTTGTYNEYITGTNLGAVLIWVSTVGTPGSAEADVFQFASLRVYGSAIAPTPAGILADVYAQAGITATDIEAITTDFSDIAFANNSKLSDRVSEVLNRGDWLARIEPRSDGTKYVPVGVLESRPSTADAMLHVDGKTVVANLEAPDAMVSLVRVTYNRLDGGKTYWLVTDASVPFTREATIDVNTTDATLASSLGHAYLSLKNNSYKGTIVIKGRFDFIPGHRYTFTGTRFGTITVRARQVDGTAQGSTLTIDETVSFDEWALRVTPR